MKKYELTDETMKICMTTLHRIKALAAFADVEIGDTGGWVEKESNLDQDGDAWVSGNSRVYGNALVSGNARVYGNAWVYGYARVSGDALVYGNALVSGDARVSDNARVSGNAWVSGKARVSDNKHYMAISPIGSSDDSITFTRDKKGGIFATVGCFYGSLTEFREKVMKRHGNTVHAQEYLLAAQLAELRIDTTPISDTQEEPTEGCEKGSADAERMKYEKL